MGTPHNDPDVDHLQRLCDHSLLTKQHTNELVRRYQEDADNTAADTLVTHNMKLIVSIARRFGTFSSDPSVFDLISACAEQLKYQVLPNFDTSRGLNLSTYATLAMRRRCSQEIAKTRKTVRVKQYLAGTMPESGDNPDDDKLHESDGLPLENGTVKQIKQLDEPLDREDPDDQGTLESLIESTAPTAAESVMREELHTRLVQLIERELSDREQMIILRRFALRGYHLRGYHRHTLGEVSAMCGLTKQRVRQVQLDAMRKLQHALETTGFDTPSR